MTDTYTQTYVFVFCVFTKQNKTKQNTTKQTKPKGAASHCIATDLSENDKHFINVNECLQSVSHPNVFGAGDCIHFTTFKDNFPPKAGNILLYFYGLTKSKKKHGCKWMCMCGKFFRCLLCVFIFTQFRKTCKKKERRKQNKPRKGVYAVREGGILIDNLLKYLKNDSNLTKYKPQTDFLRLMNAGNGTGIGCKFGIAFQV